MFLALISPLLASLIPGRPIPAVVFQVVLGAICGQHMLGLIGGGDAIDLISQLGMAFLFLLAGFEIKPNELIGEPRGKTAAVTWFVSFGLAIAAVILLPMFDIDSVTGIAVAIALSSTAIGTLMPILQERGLSETPVGKTVIAQGSFAEIGPIIAMAVLLSSRSTFAGVAILVAFFLFAALMVLIPVKAESLGRLIMKVFNTDPHPSTQTAIRSAVLIMVVLVTVASMFELDIVLGAFAAGFILRSHAGPECDSLQMRLDAIGYGFFIPVFFIVSGTAIDMQGVIQNPSLLITLVILIFLVRAVPVFFATFVPKEDRENMSWRDRITAALYSATSITIIVAVTHVAQVAHAMDQEMASTLVAAGAITVIIMPILTSITSNIAESHPIKGVQEIVREPRRTWSIVREHDEMRRASNEHYYQLYLDAKQQARVSEAKATIAQQRLHEEVNSKQNQAETTKTILEDAVEMSRNSLHEGALKRAERNKRTSNNSRDDT